MKVLILGATGILGRTLFYFLLNKKIWCHAKDFEALTILQKLNCIYFNRNQ